MNAPATITLGSRVRKFRNLLPRLDEGDQLTILSDIIEGIEGINQCDAFIDALIPLRDALVEHFDTLDAIADHERHHADWREGR